MEEKPGWSLPARQWRVMITEVPSSRLYSVSLSWRRFPCRADDWDGHQYSQRHVGIPRIESAEDLETLLSLAVGGAWYEDVRARTGTPPHRHDR